MSKLVVGNWKMNKTNAEAEAFCSDFVKFLPKNANNYCVCAPFTCLSLVSDLLGKNAKTGAQNVYYAQKGAFTGEISPEMILSCGARYVIVGHSERRNTFGESDEVIAKKVKFATENGLNVILCVGEREDERTRIVSVLKRQLKALNGVDLDKVIVAYEPVWAIGTGLVATKDDIFKAHRLIINYCLNNFGQNVQVLYGGSVNLASAPEILSIKEVAGILVGGASLDAKTFAGLVEIANK